MRCFGGNERSRLEGQYRSTQGGRNSCSQYEWASDKRNLKLAEYIDEDNPLTNGSLDQYRVYEIDVTMLTRNALGRY